MTSLEYRHDCDGLTVAALEQLFRAADLGGRAGDKILRAFRQSQRVRTAFDGTRLVGAVRCLTDFEYHALVYDLAVDPAYQRRGVGSTLLGSLLEGVTVWRVMLVADADVQPFYRRFGFAPYADVMAKLNRDALFDR